jgi:hypothetical protein
MKSIFIELMKWKNSLFHFCCLLFVDRFVIFLWKWIQSAEMILLSFIVFETCVGLYFPTQSTLRSKYVPEETRAAIMNFYRVPLNLFVVLTLKYVRHHILSFSLFSSSCLSLFSLLFLFLPSFFIIIHHNHTIVQSHNHTMW